MACDSYDIICCYITIFVFRKITDPREIEQIDGRRKTSRHILIYSFIMEISYSAIPEKQYDDSKTIDSSIIIVVPGEVITTESGFLKYL